MVPPPRLGGEAPEGAEAATFVLNRRRGFQARGSQYGSGSDPAEINHGESTCRRGLASAGLGLRSDLTDQLALTAELVKRGGKDIWGYLGLVVRF